MKTLFLTAIGGILFGSVASMLGHWVVGPLTTVAITAVTIVGFIYKNESK